MLLVLLEQAVPQAVQVQTDLQVMRDLLENLSLQEQQVLQVAQAVQGTLGHPVLLIHQELQDQAVQMVLQVMQVIQANQVLQVLVDHLDQPVLQD